jgi:predicted nucleic acid-binding protein
MMVVDASVWVSFFTPQDVHHALSVAWLTERRQNEVPMLLPVLLLPEVGGAVSRRFSDSALGYDAVRQIRAIPEVRFVPIDLEIGAIAADLAASLRLCGAAAMYVSVAYRFALPLVSWDREQLSRASLVIQTYTPLTAPSIT